MRVSVCARARERKRDRQIVCVCVCVCACVCVCVRACVRFVCVCVCTRKRAPVSKGAFAAVVYFVDTVDTIRLSQSRFHVTTLNTISHSYNECSEVSERTKMELKWSPLYNPKCDSLKAVPNTAYERLHMK